MNFQPLHVRAYLQMPVISDQYLPLDGIVFNQFIRDHFGVKQVMRPRESAVKEYSGLDLPFQKRNMNERDWYYACSFAVWSPDTMRDKIEYAKRFDMAEAERYVDFDGKRNVVNTQRGQYKNYFVREYTFNSPYVDWYCRAEKSKLETLLHFCTHIGKKSSQGMGSVLRWEVSDTARDWYKNDNAGRVMRALPSKSGNVLYGIRPSYWLPRHQAICIMPE